MHLHQGTPATSLNPALSLYLDTIRILAACAVVLCHFASQRISGGLLWRAAPYGAEAVDVFFVLSGYVIAHAAATREASARGFTAARLARIYSVALPALLLTLALDHVGYRLNPAAYVTLPGVTTGHPPAWVQAVAGLGFINEVWSWNTPIGSNVPWWSLGYEVPYYLAFGLALFGRGVWRWRAPLLVLLAAGPEVAVLAPAWLAGVAVLRLHRDPVPRGLAWVCALGSLAAWAVYEAVAWRLGRPFLTTPWLRGETPQDLLIAALFAVHLLGIGALLRGRMAPSGWGAQAVRFCAGRSFALYLFHFPILIFLRALSLRFWPGLSPFLLLPVMLVCVVGLAELTERRRGAWRRLFGGA